MSKIAIVVIIIVLVVGGFFFFSPARQEVTSLLHFTKVRGLPTIPQKQDNLKKRLLDSPLSPVFGSIKPLLDIVMFCDFQCPFCGKAYPIIREFVARHQDSVRLTYRHFPNTEEHPQAFLSALTAECAKAQNKFWPMHDKLFQNQEGVSSETIPRYAQEVGLNETSFGLCLKEKVHEGVINKDLAAALELGVQGTPTWFVNGKKVEGVIPLSVWEEMLTKVRSF